MYRLSVLVHPLCLTSLMALSACVMEDVDQTSLAASGDFTTEAVLGVFAKGWVWANDHDAPLNSPYVPSTGYQYNLRYEILDSYPYRDYSPAANNTVTRLGTGSYRVTFPNLGVSGGTVHVSAYGGNHHCKVGSWGSSSGDMNVYIRCFNPSGTAVNGRFTAFFYRDDNKSDIYANAYLWANQPTSASYTPSLYYQYNSREQTNTIRRLGTGEYEVRLPRMERDSLEPNKGGHVQVTAYGSGPERCKVRSWGLYGDDMRVYVGCVNSSGSPVDTRYTLSFMRSPGDPARAVVEDTLEGFYVWANTTPNPSDYYQSNSYGDGGATMEQLGTGSYRVHLPYVEHSDKTTAQVTAYGSGDAHCTVGGWYQDSAISGTQVQVRCYNSAGSAVNARFTLLYSTNNIILY